MSDTQLTKDKITYRDILSQKEYMKNIVANVISRFGDSVDAIAYTWLVYQITQSAAWSAIIYAFNTLPGVIIQPLAGAYVEGVSKKKLMVLSDLIRGIIVASLVLLYMNSLVTPIILVVFTLLTTTVESFCLPASSAILPSLLKEEYYEHGIALNSTLTNVMQLIGLGAAGVIIAVFGIQGAILIDAFSFFGSAFIRGLMHVKKENLRKDRLNISSYFATLKEGITYVKTKRIILNFCFLAIFLNALMVPLNALQTPLVVEVLGQGSELLSVICIVMTLAMCVGSFLYPFVAGKCKVNAIVIVSGFLAGLSLLIFTFGGIFRSNVYLVYVISIAASFLIGLSVSILTTVLGVQFTKCIEPNFLARSGAVFNASATAAMPITSGLISVLAKVLSVSQIFIIGFALCVIVFVYIAVSKMQFE